MAGPELALNHGRRRRDDAEPTRTQLPHGNPNDVQPVAILELDHLAASARSLADDSVEKDFVGQVRAGSIAGPRHRALSCEALGAGAAGFRVGRHRVVSSEDRQAASLA